MDFSAIYPLQRKASFSELSPSVHWAQFHRRGGSSYPLRRIYDFELLYVAEGNAMAYCGDRSYPIAAGDLAYLPAGVPHRVEVTSEAGAAFLGIHFDFFDELDIAADEDIIVNEASAEPNLFCREPLVDPFRPLSAEPVSVPTSRIVSLMEIIIEEFTHRPPGYEAACRGYMLQLLTSLWRNRLEAQRSIHPLYGNRMLQLAAQIESAPQEDWSVSRLAALANLQEDYVAKLFKAAVGLSPNKFVQSTRHREAKRLLRETEESVAAIGAMVGYEDLHYFSRVFNKWENMPPRAYRSLSRLL